MKTSTKLGLFGACLMLSVNAFASDSKFPCNQKIFEAVTANGQKEVKICISENGVSYTFGKVKEYKPELDIRVPFNRTSFTYWRGGMSQAFSVSNGAYTYTVNGGLEIEDLIVEKSGKTLATVKLGKVIENNIYLSSDYPIEDVGI